MGLIWIAAAALWGVAEATVFFIVPDVLLTVATVRFGWRKGLVLSAVAALGAVLAGVVLWFWGRSDAEGARHVMLMVPAVGPDLLARTAAEARGFWPLHLFVGAITGVPYKLYAVEAGALGIGLLPFAVVSFAARLARFVLSISLTALGAAGLDRLGLPRWKYATLALGWTAIYAFYFTIRSLAP